MGHLKWSQDVVNKWFNVEGNHTLRLGHDISSDGIIYEVGSYIGEGALRMSNAWGCNIYCFEPIPQYYEQLVLNTTNHSNIHPLNFGLGPETQKAYMSLEDYASSIKSSGEVEVAIVAIDEFMKTHEHNNVDLIEINIEGAEYDLLDYMLEVGLVECFDNITIQFHDVLPDASDRMQKIWQGLSETHELTYQYVFTFENWKRKGIN